MGRNFLERQAPIFRNTLAQAVLLKAATSLLVEEAGSGIIARRRLAASIRVLGNNGDWLVRRNLQLLGTATLTASGRGSYSRELRILSTLLDEVLDAIEEAAFRLSAYQFSWLLAGIPQSCVCLKACADALHLAIQETAQREPVTVDCTEISRLLKCAKELLRESCGDLVLRNAEELTIFTNREVCNMLDRALSSCEYAVDQLCILELRRAQA